MPKQKPPTHPDAAAIRAQVLRGIAGNRIPGLHFAGYFLDLAMPRVADDRIDIPVPHAPYTATPTA